MMNKKRTRTVGRIKYALFIPLAITLLLASNISCISVEDQDEIPEVPVSRVVEGEVFQIVDEMPDFPGGMAECMKFLSRNIKYPPQALEVQGQVIVQFVVTKEGYVAQPRVVRSVDPFLDAQALRVVNAMPQWKPGRQKGKAVNVRYTIPVRFRLQ